ncbi:MAG: hypothetical protein ACYSR5_07795, partial [Planctomycetota bacterium]
IRSMWGESASEGAPLKTNYKQEKANPVSSQPVKSKCAACSCTGLNLCPFEHNLACSVDYISL